ncbi:MAG TPA: PQQ-dependent sugar dehydrogenase [Nitrososphaeraceae archaeon]|nr:PQQ-dependent sugar dehydrogenase [Nitrososphaeraceae archaeon]
MILEVNCPLFLSQYIDLLQHLEEGRSTKVKSYCQIESASVMQYPYFKIAKSLPMLALIFILVTANNNIYLPTIVVAKQARATTTSLLYSSFPLHSNTATITKVQLPGILPNNNNNNNNNPSPPAASSSSSTIGNTTSASVNNRQTSAIATTTPLVHRNARARAVAGGPTLDDPHLKLERIVDTGLRSTTSMAFLEPSDMLFLEKDTGIVHRIRNGKMLPEPVLDVNVANEAERGLLGIAIAKNGDNSDAENGDNDNNKDTRHVFLYYTESGGGKDGDDASSGIEPAGNRLYRYDLDEENNKLTNPLLLLNLPASPPLGRENIERQHMGGKVLIGPDNNVYVGIGDVAGHRTQSENNPNGATPDGTGGILRVTQDGQIVDNPPLGNTLPLALYYAYGIRNTFGMDFDPVTGNLWDTENGDTFGDEINLVNPGFNSGWSQVAGIWKAGTSPGTAIGADSSNPPKGLVTFDGKGTYRAPELATLQTIGPTAIKFLSSDKLGDKYENTIFMGDVDNGNLYNFKLNEDRTGLALEGPLTDKIANTAQELQEGGAVLGQGFGVITDMQVGPDDGYLYILTLNGSLYRIVPNSSPSSSSSTATS